MEQQGKRIQVLESLTPREPRSTMVGILVFVAVVISVINAIASGQADWHGLGNNLSTALIGAALTVFTLDLFQERRDDMRLKQRLLWNLRSTDSSIAVNALEEVRSYGWLYDGTLHSADLTGSNLQGATLVGANLEGATLFVAKLQSAELWHANLSGAYMEGVHLENANLLLTNLKEAYLANAVLEGAKLLRANMVDTDLRGAWLEGAYLRYANLQGAELRQAQMQGANLTGANLKSVVIADKKYSARFDENTVLPDGTHWTPATDMARFTNPNHPDFWRSDNPGSPAYRGDA